MRFSTACITALSAGLVAAGPLEPRGWLDQEIVINEARKVPGDSPLELCDSDHSKDIVYIERVDLLPNPPAIGAKLSIKATGTVYEPIVDGATVEVEVKYGPIRLLRTTADFCEQTSQVDLECPIEKGVLSLTKEVDIPNEVPAGTYTVKATVINADKKPITCLQATVKMEKPAMSDL